MTRRIFLGAAILVAALLVWWLRGALAVLFWGALLAYVLGPLVALLERRGLARGLAVLLVFAALAAALAIVLAVVIPVAAHEAGRVVQQMPAWNRQVGSLLGRIQSWHRRLDLPLSVDRAVAANIRAVERQAAEAGAQAGKTLVRALPGLLNVVLAPVVAGYLLLEAPRLRRGVLMLFPPGVRPHVEELIWRLDLNLGGFLRGQILVAFSVGVMAGIAATAFGLGYGLIIGLVAGITEVVPYVGPVIGAIPAVLLALLKSPQEALWVAAAFFAIHQIEGGLLSPAIVGQEMGMKPLAVLLALFVGGELGGVVGLVLAVPVAGALVVGTRWAWNLFTVPEPFR